MSSKLKIVNTVEIIRFGYYMNNFLLDICLSFSNLVSFCRMCLVSVEGCLVTDKVCLFTYRECLFTDRECLTKMNPCIIFFLRTCFDIDHFIIMCI